MMPARARRRRRLVKAAVFFAFCALGLATGRSAPALVAAVGAFGVAVTCIFFVRYLETRS